MPDGFITRTRQFYSTRRINTWVIFYVLVYIILVIKLITIQEIDTSLVFGIYSVLVSFYILSRFALAYFYAPDPTRVDPSFEPTISFGIPAKNEEANIKETILRIAATDYPKDKFDVIAINDGSTDRTLDEMMAAQHAAAIRGVNVRIINWQQNKGKREGMAECVRQSSSDIVIFIDSDSFVEPSTARALVKYFADPRVAAVAGHAYVANADANVLTKMQDVRYFIAFKAYKAAEALFGAVTCCSGCCSAYRRVYLGEVLDPWLHQQFLGVQCTYGDDRSLTNFLLQRGYQALFAPEAKAYTFVPDSFRQFMRQQLRWKKSWVRESLKAAAFIWRKNPLMSMSFYLGVLLPLIAPVVVVRALLWYPYATGKAPWFYLIGLVLMATVYGLYYYVYTRDRKWVYGVLFATFYTLILIWQLPYAILNLRDARWGTR
jgi:hyaluronan synthase